MTIIEDKNSIKLTEEKKDLSHYWDVETPSYKRSFGKYSRAKEFFDILQEMLVKQYCLIEVKGFWLDEKEHDTKNMFVYTAAIGQYDGESDDDHIFYWFNDIDEIFKKHEEFNIVEYQKL